MTTRKTPHPSLVLSLAAVASALAGSLGAGCNGCNPTNQSYPSLDAGAEYPIARGSATVNATVEGCPVAPASLAVTPATAVVGQAVSVTGLLASADAASATLTWSASGMMGTFASPHALATTFICTVAGPTKLTLSVTQGDCTSQRDLAYYCYGQGDGGMGVVGGAGGSGGPSGSTGGTSGTTGGMSGATGGVVSATGGVPGSTGGMPGATGGVPASGGSPGNKITNTCPADEPLPKGTGPACGGKNAPGDCEMTCSDCAADQCSLGQSGTDGCCGLKGVTDQALCVTLLNCLVAHPATITMGDATNAFCGTSGGSCFMTAGAANGPCTAEVFAAAKTMAPATVQGQFTSPASPLGRAVNIVACMGGFCSASCGVP